MIEEIKDKILELIENKRMSDLQQLLDDVNSADFPSLFEELNEEEIIIIYRLLSKEKAAEVFAELDSDVQEKLINFLTDKFELTNKKLKFKPKETVNLMKQDKKVENGKINLLVPSGFAEVELLNNILRAFLYLKHGVKSKLMNYRLGNKFGST